MHAIKDQNEFCQNEEGIITYAETKGFTEDDVNIRRTSTGRRVLKPHTVTNYTQQDVANESSERRNRRRVRGKAKNLSIRTYRNGGKIKVPFNSHGKTTGGAACLKKKKEKMLQLNKDDFIIHDDQLLPEENDLITRSMYQSLGKAWHDFMKELYELYLSYVTDEEAIRNCPSDLTKSDWEFLIKKYWKSDYLKAASARNKISRSKQSMLHCTGRTRFSVIEHEYTNNNNGVAPSRLRMFEMTRTRKDKKVVDVAAEEKLAQIRELELQRQEGTIDISDDEISSRVLGHERSRNICMPQSSIAGRYYSRLDEINKYKEQLDDSQARAIHAEKVAVDAQARAEQIEKVADDLRARVDNVTEKVKNVHAYIGKIFSLLQSRRDGDRRQLDKFSNEELEIP